MKPIPFVESRRDRNDTIERVLMITSMVAAGVTAFMVTLNFKQKTVDPVGAQPLMIQSQAYKTLSAEVEQLRTQFKSLQVDSQKLTALPPDNKLALQISQMQDATKDLGTRLERLENAILASPAKALEIPLLQRDLENLRLTQQSNLVAVKDGVDRLYDLNKWLLGAMAISVITLALSNFLRPRELPPKAGAE